MYKILPFQPTNYLCVMDMRLAKRFKSLNFYFLSQKFTLTFIKLIFNLAEYSWKFLYTGLLAKTFLIYCCNGTVSPSGAIMAYAYVRDLVLFFQLIVLISNFLMSFLNNKISTNGCIKR